MPEDYDSVNTLCPFYKCENPLKIECEGVLEKSNIHNCFQDKPSKVRQKKHYCNKFYKECPLYKAINKKYEDE